MNEWTFHKVLVRIFNWFLLRVCSVFITFKNLKLLKYLGIFLQVWTVLCPDIRVHSFLALGIARQINPFLVYCWPEGFLGLSFQHSFLEVAQSALNMREHLQSSALSWAPNKFLIYINFSNDHYYVPQKISHPSTNQARPCLASEIRRDRARSGWYGHRHVPQKISKHSEHPRYRGGVGWGGGRSPHFAHPSAREQFGMASNRKGQSCQHSLFLVIQFHF